MYTLIKHSDFNSLEECAREIGFQGFMWDLRYKLFFEDQELDLYFPQALEIEALIYYLGEMRDAGLGAFILNYESNLQDERWVNIFLRGCDHCGAKQNKAFFELILQNREAWKSCNGYFPGGPEAREKHEEKARKIESEYYYLDKDLVATSRDGESPLLQLGRVPKDLTKVKYLRLLEHLKTLQKSYHIVWQFA